MPDDKSNEEKLSLICSGALTKAMQKYASIHEAVKCEDIKEVEEMVKCGANINEISHKNKFTPLHSACNAGALECLHWLLWQGANPTICTPQGWTPLHIASIRGHDFCLQALVNNNVTLNSKDNRGSTALHMAAAHGNSFCLNTLMRAGADVHVVDKNGWTPMHAAAFHGRLGCVQTLFKWHGKIDETDNYGNTPAHLAAMEGHLLCLKFFVSCKSDPKDLLGARNDHGEIPKDLAEQFYKEDVTKYIEAVDKEQQYPEDMNNLSFPAHLAASRGDVEYLKMLIENGVININERDEKGSTPAHKAAGQGHINVLQWLIEMGADMNITNDLGDKPKNIAERFGHLACVKLLITACPDEEEEESISIQEVKQSPFVQEVHLQKQAKSRARQKMIQLEHELEIARKNYLQLGGVLQEEQKKMEYMKEKDQHINELDAQLEYERLRREKLEVQLDHCQQQVAYLNSKLAQQTAVENNQWMTDAGRQSSSTKLKTLKKGNSEGSFIKKTSSSSKKKPMKTSMA